MSHTYKYAHMCRLDHDQIGHNDSSSEMCPLCRAIDELATLKAQRDELLEALKGLLPYASAHSLARINGTLCREELDKSYAAIFNTTKQP